MTDAMPSVYRRLRELTQARLALGTSGSSLATSEWLAFQYDWARARDAVYYALDFDDLAARIEGLGLETVRVASAAPSREVYLRRPDLGRQLSDESAERLGQSAPTKPDVAVVVADGLSGWAVDQNAAPLIEALRERAGRGGWRLGSIVLVSQGRVAVGDPIGALLGARLTLLLIGERPGLSAADSLGAYLTYEPCSGRTDAERNCVSNIREGGQPPASAADTIGYIIDRAFAAGQTGVALKDETALLQHE